MVERFMLIVVMSRQAVYSHTFLAIVARNANFRFKLLALTE